MIKAFQPQYITDETGKRISVVVSIQQWQKLLEELEELDDIHLYDEVKTRNEPTISLADYKRKRKQVNG